MGFFVGRNKIYRNPGGSQTISKRRLPQRHQARKDRGVRTLGKPHDRPFIFGNLEPRSAVAAIVWGTRCINGGTARWEPRGGNKTRFPPCQPVYGGTCAGGAGVPAVVTNTPSRGAWSPLREGQVRKGFTATWPLDMPDGRVRNSKREGVLKDIGKRHYAGARTNDIWRYRPKRLGGVGGCRGIVGQAIGPTFCLSFSWCCPNS